MGIQGQEARHMRTQDYTLILADTRGFANTHAHAHAHARTHTHIHTCEYTHTHEIRSLRSFVLLFSFHAINSVRVFVCVYMCACVCAGSLYEAKEIGMGNNTTNANDPDK